MLQTHIVRVGLFTVDANGNRINRSASTTDYRIIASARQEQLVIPSNDIPNSHDYPTIKEYLEAEASDGYIVGSLNQSFITTTLAAVSADEGAGGDVEPPPDEEEEDPEPSLTELDPALLSPLLLLEPLAERGQPICERFARGNCSVYVDALDTFVVGTPHGLEVSSQVRLLDIEGVTSDVYTVSDVLDGLSFKAAPAQASHEDLDCVWEDLTPASIGDMIGRIGPGAGSLYCTRTQGIGKDDPLRPQLTTDGLVFIPFEPSNMIIAEDNSILSPGEFTAIIIGRRTLNAKSVLFNQTLLEELGGITILSSGSLLIATALSNSQEVALSFGEGSDFYLCIWRDVNDVLYCRYNGSSGIVTIGPAVGNMLIQAIGGAASDFTAKVLCWIDGAVSDEQRERMALYAANHYGVTWD